MPSSRLPSALHWHVWVTNERAAVVASSGRAFFGLMHCGTQRPAEPPNCQTLKFAVRAVSGGRINIPVVVSQVLARLPWRFLQPPRQFWSLILAFGSQKHNVLLDASEAPSMAPEGLLPPPGRLGTGRAFPANSPEDYQELYARWMG